MAIVDKTVLKGYFTTGSVPTQAQYINLIDTLVSWLEDLPAAKVQAAGAVMVADAVANAFGFVNNDATFANASANKLSTMLAIKTYVLAQVQVSGGAANVVTDVDLPGVGVNLEMSYTGPLPPIVGGTKGAITVTEPVGTRILNFYLDAPSATAATTGQNISVTVISGSGLRRRFACEVTEYGDNKVVLDGGIESGFVFKHTSPAANQVVRSFTGLGTLAGFGIFFTR